MSYKVPPLLVTVIRTGTKHDEFIEKLFLVTRNEKQCTPSRRYVYILFPKKYLALPIIQRQAGDIICCG